MSTQFGIAAVADGHTLRIIPFDLNSEGNQRVAYGCHGIQEEEAALKADRQALRQLNEEIQERERRLAGKKERVGSLAFSHMTLPKEPMRKLGSSEDDAQYIQKLIRENPHIPVSGTLTTKVDAVLKHLNVFKYNSNFPSMTVPRTIWNKGRDAFLDATLHPYSPQDRKAIRAEITRREQPMISLIAQFDSQAFLKRLGLSTN